MRVAIFDVSDIDNVNMTDYINYSYNLEETKFYVCWDSQEYIHSSLSENTPLEIVAYDLESVIEDDYVGIEVEQLFDDDGVEFSEEAYLDVKKWRYIVDTQFMLDRIQDVNSEWYGGVFTEALI